MVAGFSMQGASWDGANPSLGRSLLSLVSSQRLRINVLLLGVSIAGIQCFRYVRFSARGSLDEEVPQEVPAPEEHSLVRKM